MTLGKKASSDSRFLRILVGAKVSENMWAIFDLESRGVAEYGPQWSESGYFSPPPPPIYLFVSPQDLQELIT